MRQERRAKRTSLESKILSVGFVGFQETGRYVVLAVAMTTEATWPAMADRQLKPFLEKVKADTSLQEKLKAAGYRLLMQIFNRCKLLNG